MHESTILKTGTTFFGSVIFLAFGALDIMFRVLLLFIILDYITGLMKGFKKKELSSAVGWNGLMKKIGTLIAVIVAHQMDKIAGTEMFRVSVIAFFVANEGISLTENLTIIGVPLPKIMIRTLKVWKEETEVD